MDSNKNNIDEHKSRLKNQCKLYHDFIAKDWEKHE